MDAKRHRRCPTCGSSLTTSHRLPHGRVLRCRSAGCGLELLDPQPTDGDLQRLYENLYYPGEFTTEAALKPNSAPMKLQQHFEALEALVGLRGKRLLDYGCGTGNFLQVALGNGVAAAVGIETNSRARQSAQARGLQVLSGLEELSAAERFDLVYMNDVLEHLRDPATVCKRLASYLSPEGVLFIATINARGLKARLLRSRWDMYLDPTHLYYFTGKSLSRLLLKSGYAQAEVLSFAVRFSHHGGLRRRLQNILVRRGLDSSLRIIARARRETNGLP